MKTSEKENGFSVKDCVELAVVEMAGFAEDGGYKGEIVRDTACLLVERFGETRFMNGLNGEQAYNLARAVYWGLTGRATGSLITTENSYGPHGEGESDRCRVSYGLAQGCENGRLKMAVEQILDREKGYGEYIEWWMANKGSQ